MDLRTELTELHVTKRWEGPEVEVSLVAAFVSSNRQPGMVKVSVLLLGTAQHTHTHTQSNNTAITVLFSFSVSSFTIDSSLSNHYSLPGRGEARPHCAANRAINR